MRTLLSLRTVVACSILTLSACSLGNNWFNEPDGGLGFVHPAPQCQPPLQDCGTCEDVGCDIGYEPVCVDTSTDTQHCGDCFQVCPTGVACNAGVCGVPSPPAAKFNVAATLAGPPLQAMGGHADDGVYLVGATGQILHSADHGVTWAAQSSGTTAPLFGVWGAGAGTVYVAGDAGTLLATRDGGQTWTGTGPAGLSGAVLRGIWGARATDVYVTGAAGEVAHSTDGGSSWQVLTPPELANQDLSALYGLSTGDLYAISRGSGTIFHTTDQSGAAAWTAQNTFLAAVSGFWGSAPYNFNVAGFSADGSGDVATTEHSIDGGNTWYLQSAELSGSPTSLSAVCSGSGADVYLGGDSGILYSPDNGVTWNPIWTAGPVSALWSDGAGHVYALSGNQVLARSP